MPSSRSNIIFGPFRSCHFPFRVEFIVTPKNLIAFTMPMFLESKQISDVKITGFW